MANSNSGTVILGVNDGTREIPGIPDEALDLVETWLRTIANDLIKPPLSCQIKKIQVELPAAIKNVARISGSPFSTAQSGAIDTF